MVFNKFKAHPLIESTKLKFLALHCDKVQSNRNSFVLEYCSGELKTDTLCGHLFIFIEIHMELDQLD